MIRPSSIALRPLACAALALAAGLPVGCSSEEAENVASSSQEFTINQELAFPGRRGEVRRGAFAIDGEVLTLTYELIDGHAVFEGDILLPREDELALGADGTDSEAIDLGLGGGGGLQPQGAGRQAASYRWPSGVVPYVVDAALSSPSRVTEAIAHWQASTSIRFRAKRSEDRNWVRFVAGEGCSSAVGRSGSGEQRISLASGCPTGAVIHEIGHAVGLWHEQSRADRDRYVIVNEANITSGMAYNFEKYTDRNQNGKDYGKYDFGSIMHYPPTAFSIGRGKYTLLKRASPSDNVGAPFEVQRTKLSAIDRASVEEMYGNPADAGAPDTGQPPGNGDGGVACSGRREAEPNDSSRRANAIDTVICGAIDTGADVDWFTWSVASANVDYRIAVSGEARMQLWKRTTGDYYRLTTSPTDAIASRSGGPGTYLIAVSSPSGTAQSYTLTLTR